MIIRSCNVFIVPRERPSPVPSCQGDTLTLGAGKSLSDWGAVLIQNATQAFLLIFAGLEILISTSANRRFFALWFLNEFATPLKRVYRTIHGPIIIHLWRDVKFV